MILWLTRPYNIWMGYQSCVCLIALFPYSGRKSWWNHNIFVNRWGRKPEIRIEQTPKIKLFSFQVVANFHSFDRQGCSQCYSPQMVTNLIFDCWICKHRKYSIFISEWIFLSKYVLLFVRGLPAPQWLTTYPHTLTPFSIFFCESKSLGTNVTQSHTLYIWYSRKYQ